MNTLQRFSISIVGALALGAAAGYALLLSAPCHWFGSPSEGACGYGGLGYAVWFGALVGAVSLALILRYTASTASAANPKENTPAPRKLIIWWVALLVLHFIFPALALMAPHWAFDALHYASKFTLPAFIISSAILAPYRGYHPAVALLALIPIAGVLVVGTLLFLSKPTQALGK